MDKSTVSQMSSRQ